MIELIRTYQDEITTGSIFFNDVEICRSIELPWAHNAPNMSCIPEGEYSLQHRHTEKFGDHLLVENVPGRTWILFHPANHAKKELRGLHCARHGDQRAIWDAFPGGTQHIAAQH
ncbi:MAG: hypothetical protein IPO26_18800 [Saprospiraceae bacterium]|nr:hypothetical protein [Saprospiraceae bacterium]